MISFSLLLMISEFSVLINLKVSNVDFIDEIHWIKLVSNSTKAKLK